MANGNGAASSYLKLVGRVPLRPIRSEAELDRAIAMIDSLLDRMPLKADESDYLDVLSDLVVAYEDKHYPIEDVQSDAEAIRLLTEARGITQQALAKATGIANSTISAVLHGQRQLNRKHIERLCEFFKVEPRLFMSGR